MQSAIDELEAKGKAAKAASRKLAFLSTEVKNRALANIAAELISREGEILAANQLDYEESKASGMGAADKIFSVEEEVMLDNIIALAALCKLAIEGGNKALEAYKKKKLSETEKELLIAAAKDGEFLIIHVAGPPDWIRVGRKNFPRDITGDPAIAERYHGAFESLCKRGYIRHDDGRLFRLTDRGFEKARQLAATK